MDVRSTFLTMLWLLFAPFGNATAPVMEFGTAAPDAMPLRGVPHRYVERLHERWLPAIERNLRRPREFAVDMICDLFVTLSVADVMAECKVAFLPDTAPPRDLDHLPWSIEERMRSI